MLRKPVFQVSASLPVFFQNGSSFYHHENEKKRIKRRQVLDLNQALYIPNPDNDFTL